MQTAKTLLAEAQTQLQQAGVDTAKLDARLLLQHAANLSHEQLIADPDIEIDQARAQAFEFLVAKRVAREPVSRILGQREFYGRSFHVSPAVLDPRADSETLIEAALSLPRPTRILDLGTGSGILCVTLLAEIESARGTAVDISQAALDVAKTNALALGVSDRIEFSHGSWFQGLSDRYDLIVSNPPYIPAHEIATLVPEVRAHDPHLALDGGPDGLDPYRAIAAVAAEHLQPKGHILVEIGAEQEADITAIFVAEGFAAHGIWRDLGGHVRVLGFSPAQRKPLDSP